MNIHAPIKWVEPGTNKTYNLQKADMDPAATFVCLKLGLKIKLISKEEEKNPVSGFSTPVPGTGLTLKFTYGQLVVDNRKCLELLMESTAFVNGKIRMDPDDPTGFWRQMGNVEVRTVKVAVFDGMTQPNFAALKGKLKDLKPVGDVEQLSRVVA